MTSSKKTEPSIGGNPPAVAVFGSSDPTEGSDEYTLAMESGNILAKLGYTVVNGGYGGTMEASARGAKQADGKTIGVICRLWKSQPNKYIDTTIQTHNLFGRIEKLIELGTGGFLVLPGATGTLAELALAWELMFKKLMLCRPLVCLGEFWQPLIGIMDRARPTGKDFVKIANSPAELCNFFGGPRLA